MSESPPIFDWLVDGAPGAGGPAEVVQRLCDGLYEGGLPIHRCAAFVRTLHPHIMGRSFTWKAGEQVVVREASYEFLETAEFRKSPPAYVSRTGETLHRATRDAAAQREFPMLADLAEQGFCDYLAMPLRFLSGQIHPVTFATRDPSGFTEEHLGTIRHVLRPLARVAEILALGRTAANLLSTYVGRNAGERIMAGKIVRGDTDSIRAILWFSDLRGFTALAASVQPVKLIGALNDLFECQVTAIERHGGEVLKFMGDGMLAIFPIEGSALTPGELCDAALGAAGDALAAIARLNLRRVERGDPALRVGISLHTGDVAYGNIGGANRLDFTAIGPAVNVASRLEGLTALLGRPVVVSDEFARLTSRAVVGVGTFALKGVTEPQAVFAPTGEPLLAAW
jgi:adenylate cyclase